MSTNVANEHEFEGNIERIESTPLDQLIMIFEISFIFLLTFTLITLIDTALSGLSIYKPISSIWLGEDNVGMLDGGNWEQIVRITILFNGLLFAFSLGFGLWMRKTRDGWSWSQLGYTLKSENENAFTVFRKGIALGFLVIFIYYLFLSIALFINSGGNSNVVLSLHSFNIDGISYTPKQLLAEYYFGIIEMGIIWPLSAGFFFFAYTHNSLRARFPIGVANVLSTLFYVFYLLFFFMIPVRGKLSVLPGMLTDPVLWANLIVFFIILYISFSAFTSTRSILLPFTLNFVLNVGLTTFKSLAALMFPTTNYLQLLPFLFTGIMLIIWYFIKPSDFNTIKEGITQFRQRENMSILRISQFFSIFFVLAFVIPLIIEQIVFEYSKNLLTNRTIVPLLFAILFNMIIILAILVLTYKPTKVYDVLLMTKGGLPIASKINLFQSDKVLIAGFFAALAGFNQELEKGQSDLKSIKKGERDIIIEDGVFTRLVALVDKDQQTLRNNITKIHRDFEIEQKNFLEDKGTLLKDEIKEAHPYVEAIAHQSVTFNVSQETKWISILTLLVTPLMILLIGLI